MSVLELTPAGLYCPDGDFYIDPWKPVPRAVVTHAHSDHARWGCGSYVAAAAGEPLFRVRLGQEAEIDFLRYGEERTIGGVQLSLHPAGHILGSAQVRLARRDEVWVVSGDYKRDDDPTCAAFEPVRCHLFVTESTFGMPVYRWPPVDAVFDEIHAWWRGNQAEGKASLLYGYAVGKSQRLLAGLDPEVGPIFTHGALQRPNEAYRAAGVELPPTTPVSEAPRGMDWSQAIVLAVPSAHGTPWMRRFGAVSTAMASGWMRIRGTRRRRALDRGFVLSDHIDWPALLDTIRDTGTERVWVTHGYSPIVVRYLTEQGLDAAVLETQFLGESLDDEPTEPDESPQPL